MARNVIAGEDEDEDEYNGYGLRADTRGVRGEREE